MIRGAWSPPNAIERRTGLFLVVACFVWAAVGAMATRGIWYDEIWSVYVARHDIGFVEALRTRWLTDNHPPAFYALAWLAEPGVGDTIGARRALNFLPVVLAGGVLWWFARRRGDLIPFILLLIVMLLASREMIAAMADHRAYATQLSGNAVLATALAAIATARDDYARTDRGLLASTALTMLLCFNLHFIGALISGAVVGVVGIMLSVSGRRGWGLRLLGTALLAAVPSAIACVVQRRLLVDTATHFWATTSNGHARKLLSRAATTAAWCNPLATGAGLWTLFRGDRADTMRRFAAILFVACVLTGLALYVANTVRPFLVTRYLTALQPFLLAILAALAAGTILSHRASWWGTIAVATGTLSYGATVTPAQRNWTDTAAHIARQVAACPETVVHARGHWIAVDHPHLMTNEAAIVRFGYERLARAYGFAIEPLGSTRRSSRCPTLLWVEHLPGRSVDARSLVQAAGLPASHRATLWHGETGIVVTLLPR